MPDTTLTVDAIDLSDHDAFVEAVPHEWFALLRREAPVFWQDERRGRGFWSLTRYDDILAASIEERLPLEAIVARGHAPETVRRVLKMIITSEYKRRQAAPVLKVSAKAFGEGRRLPIAHGFRYE